jgi:hypothetical protein
MPPIDRTNRILALETLAAELLETARQLRPGAERNDILKEIGRLRAQLNGIQEKNRLRDSRLVRSPKSKSKEDSAEG